MTDKITTLFETVFPMAAANPKLTGIVLVVLAVMLLALNLIAKGISFLVWLLRIAALLCLIGGVLLLF